MLHFEQSGILLGPSALGSTKAIAAIFPREGFLVLDTVAMFVFMFYMFLAGVKMDIGGVKRAGKKAWAIAFSSITFPLLLLLATSALLNASFDFDSKLAAPVRSYLTITFSISPFPVISALLADLKLLSTELGHLATACSMASDILFFTYGFVRYVNPDLYAKSPIKMLLPPLSVVCVLLFVFLVLRPFLTFIGRKSPTGRPVEEGYICFILVMVLVLGFYTDMTGHTIFFGPFLLGLAVPDGPPLGETLVKRFEAMISGVLLPLYIASSGLNTNVVSAFEDLQAVGAVEVFVVVGTIGKIVGVILPCLVSDVVFRDALALGLVMSSKGIIDLTVASILTDYGVCFQLRRPN